MKLVPLPGLFFHIIQIHRLRLYNLNFNKIKYYKANYKVLVYVGFTGSRGAASRYRAHLVVTLFSNFSSSPLSLLF